jgi:multimeric flavodoxin WrbA
MKVIGFSAGSVGREGNIDRMVKAILDRSGHEAEFVKLTDAVATRSARSAGCT